MTLATYSVPDDLYLAKGDDVNPHRPLFTGDVLDDIAIAGVQDSGKAIIIAHPCSMRGRNAALLPSLLCAPVDAHHRVNPHEWATGFYDRSPLPTIPDGTFSVANFGRIGQATVPADDLPARIACASEFGVNLLQQRLIWYLTRFEVDTSRIGDAFSHTFEEASELEEWIDTLNEAGMPMVEAARLFDEFIRAPQPNGRTLQDDLTNLELRSAVRTACRRRARQLAEQYHPQSFRPS